MAKRIVDTLETIKIEKQDGELHRLRSIICRGGLPAAYLIEQGAKYPSVRETGERIFGTKANRVCLGVRSFCDVGERLYETAIREAPSTNLDDRSVRHRPFANAEFSWNKFRQDPNGSVGQFSRRRRAFSDLIESWRVLDELRG